jgi:signal transduction histidine kinase
MYDETKIKLDNAQTLASNATRTLRQTNRSMLRSYLKAAFELQRAGLEAVEALQEGAEELTFSVLDRTEEMQDRAMQQAQTRMRESVEQLREVRERTTEAVRENNEWLRDARHRLEDRLREGRGEMEEAGDRTESRVRDGAEIALKVARVIETRVETMLSELIDASRREVNEIDDRVDAMLNRLDVELEEQIHPIPNYDDKNVEEVMGALDGLDEMQLRTVRAYEVSHKNRITVLRAVDERLADQMQAEAQAEPA